MVIMGNNFAVHYKIFTLGKKTQTAASSLQKRYMYVKNHVIQSIRQCVV